MNYLVELLTFWTGSGTESDPNAPYITPGVAWLSWVDVTGQQAIQPEPNAFIIEMVVDEAGLALLEADSNVLVLSSEEVIEEVVDEVEE
jgi:hypothetical protein